MRNLPSDPHCQRQLAALPPKKANGPKGTVLILGEGAFLVYIFVAFSCAFGIIYYIRGKRSGKR
jgi:hypothetical protein